MYLHQKTRNVCLAIQLSVSLIWAINTCAQTILAQELAKPAVGRKLPKTIIFPWQFRGIDPDISAQYAKPFNEAQKQLALEVSPDATPLSKTDDFLEKFIASDAGTTDHSWVPILSKCQGQLIVHLAVVDSVTGVLKSVSHELIDPETWKKSRQQVDATRLFSNQLKKLIAKVQSKLTDNSQTPQDMAIAFSSAGGSRADEWDRNSMNLVLAEAMFGRYIFVDHLMSETLARVHKAYGLSPKLRRPNRTLLTQWTFPDTRALISKQFPIEVHSRITPTESVFAKALPWTIDEDVVIDRTENSSIIIKLSSKLMEHLDQELKALNRSELPKVAKTYGAWVYLDKGRAYGLRVNDRLVISTGDGTIKGHIIGYFGPEAKLLSTRGWPIHEGAIMFVRKGQKLTKLGQEFIYDRMTVPTPWPPKSTNSNTAAALP